MKHASNETIRRPGSLRHPVKKKTPKPKALSRGFRVVALGGGTGLSTILRGLKEYVVRRSDEHPNSERPISDLTAIVTVTDDGGSSGRLRRENRVLPPGDIRNCMVALSKDEALLGRLFQYRFHAGRGLVGHNFGNLFLAALTHVTGDFAEAIRVSSKVLAIRGRIFPSTLSNVHLVGKLVNGRTVRGETNITASRTPIDKVSLSPRRVQPFPAVIDAIRQADLILLGPGSLYTSVLPNLLIPEIAAAIAKSTAPRVYIANLMTQPGETAAYSLSRSSTCDPPPHAAQPHRLGCGQPPAGFAGSCQTLSASGSGTGGDRFAGASETGLPRGTRQSTRGARRHPPQSSAARAASPRGVSFSVQLFRTLTRVSSSRAVTHLQILSSGSLSV